MNMPYLSSCEWGRQTDTHGHGMLGIWAERGMQKSRVTYTYGVIPQEVQLLH